MKPREQRYLLICNTSDGLVAQLNGVVVQMQFAHRMGMIPVVYLHRKSYLFGGPNPYFDEQFGDNVWNYYYESIGGNSEYIASLIQEGRLFTLSTASELVRLYRWEPESWFMNPYGYFRSVENFADVSYPSKWWNSEREKARKFIQDGAFSIRKDIMENADRFCHENFSPNTLGVQLRGSDKFDFGVGKNLSRKVIPREYYDHINRYISLYSDCKIFVATDQRQWLRDLQVAYPDKVISFSQKSLSDTDKNLFHSDRDKASRGSEVLMDVILLSKCNYLLKCHAAVGEMALTLNPELKFTDLNYYDQPFEVKARWSRMVCVPLIKVLCRVWRTLSERSLALEKVVAVEGDHVLVGAKRPRPLNTKQEADVKAPRPPIFSRRFLSDAFDWTLRRLGDLCFRYEERRPAR